MEIEVNTIEGAELKPFKYTVPDGSVPGEIAEHLEFTENVHQFIEPPFPFGILISRKEDRNEFFISVEAFGTCEYFKTYSVKDLMILFANTLSPFLVPFYLEHFYRALRGIQQQGNRPGGK